MIKIRWLSLESTHDERIGDAMSDFDDELMEGRDWAEHSIWGKRYKAIKRKEGDRRKNAEAYWSKFKPAEPEATEPEGKYYVGDDDMVYEKQPNGSYRRVAVN